MIENIKLIQEKKEIGMKNLLEGENINIMKAITK
jgi:hypothetical protein